MRIGAFVPARILTLIILFAGTFFFVSSSGAATIQMTDDGRTAGYVTLAWPDAKGNVLLERKDGANWTEIYKGSDGATTLTGLPNGTYAYRVTDDTGVSPVFTVTIAHHPLSRAFSFFGMGFIMFMVLLALLFRGPSADPEASQ